MFLTAMTFGIEYVYTTMTFGIKYVLYYNDFLNRVCFIL